MSNLGISYEQVASAAEKIVAAGQKPSNDSVRKLLGSGSMTTISKHMRAWKAEQPAEKREAVELNEELKRNLVTAFESHAAKQTSVLRDELVDAEKTEKELTYENEQLERKIEEIERQNTNLVIDLDQSSSRQESLLSELESLKNELDSVRKYRDELTLKLAEMKASEKLINDSKIALENQLENAFAAIENARAETKKEEIKSAELQVEIRREKEASEALKARSEKQESEILQARKNESEASDSLHQLSVDCAILKEKNQALLSQDEEKKATITELKATITELKATITELKKKEQPSKK